MNAKEIIESVTEARRGYPRLDVAKKHRVKLTPEERTKVVKAGAVWPHDKSPGVWKAVVNGKTWYIANTHRAWVCHPTLSAAIKDFPLIESTA